jgi:hypothetical protein
LGREEREEAQRQRGEGGTRERRGGRGVGKPLGYFFTNPNDYIASLFIVLRRLAS